MKDIANTVSNILSAGAAAGALVSSYFPGGNPPMGDFNEAMSAATQFLDMAKNVTSTMKRNTGGEDVQYVAAIRNTRSRYGKKRRRNLKNAWYEIDKDKVRVWSRFQCFRENGFSSAIGPIPTVYTNTGSFVGLPLYVFRLASFPQSGHVNQSGSTQPIAPLVMYQLTRTVLGGANPVYTWSPVNSLLESNQTGTSAQINTWDVYKAQGNPLSGIPLLHGFRHEWSNIKLTFYPQTNLPTDWTVRLVKFKDEIPSYPPQQGRRPDNTVENVYLHTNAATGFRSSAVTMMWDSYFGGKILHPHNTQPVSKTDFGKLPFVPLKTEKFYVPAREQTTAEAPTRVLHKEFFRNDRHFTTRTQFDVRLDNPQTLGKWEYIDENINGNQQTEVTPLTSPGDEIWLMVEATGYKTSLTAPTAAATWPTFDICMRSCHSYLTSDEFGDITQYNRPAPPPSIVEPNPEDIKETENADIKETENPVN